MKEKIHNVYPEVLSLVNDGSTISSALRRLKVNNSTFYKYITPVQKVELQHAITLHTKFGAGYSNR